MSFYGLDDLTWIDNLGNALEVGHLAMGLSGEYAYEFRTVTKLTKRRDDPFGYRAMLCFDKGGMLSNYNAISLTALGIGEADICMENRGKPGYDVLGHFINNGDRVLYLSPLQAYTGIATVIKKTAKMCLLDTTPQLRKKDREIISLTAIGLQDYKIIREDE